MIFPLSHTYITEYLSQGSIEEIMLKEISFRLGMSGSLYIGFCLGIMTSAIVMGCLLLLSSPGAVLGIIVAMALILAGILISIIIIYNQEKIRKTSEPLCTCRYRSSVNTLCRECALNEKSRGTTQDSSD